MTGLRLGIPRDIQMVSDSRVELAQAYQHVRYALLQSFGHGNDHRSREICVR